MKYLEIRTPDCVADDFGGEIVALNLQNGLYFSLRELAACAWRDLVAGHSVETIVAAVASLDPQLAKDANAMMVRFVDSGLMREIEPGHVAGGSPSVVGAIAGGATALIMQSYDDMADLVMTDPIHDVDLTVGWPVKRDEA